MVQVRGRVFSKSLKLHTKSSLAQFMQFLNVEPGAKHPGWFQASTNLLKGKE